MARIAGKPVSQVAWQDLVFTETVTVELDGVSGKGQIFYREP